MLRELLPDETEVGGLVCLMELHRAREAGRVDPDGAAVLLADQNRSRWDALAIARAWREVDRLAAAGEAGPYLLQAGIAACHARAADFDATDWHAIVGLYDRLQDGWPSPVVTLNRAVALAMAEGPEAALPLVEALADDPRLQRYAPLEAVRADLFRRMYRAGRRRRPRTRGRSSSPATLPSAATSRSDAPNAQRGGPSPTRRGSGAGRPGAAR